MADLSWFLCCEKFTIKPDGLCDAHNLLFELEVRSVPSVGQVSIDLVALWRSEDWEREAPIQIRIGVIFADGIFHPSQEVWTVNFTSPQVLWVKQMSELYLQEYGFSFVAIQALENGEWVTKSEYPILILGGR